jgi:2-polyprenyl-3-methyl-5-hydroxy-6-metoxy-1,4-benzoquinol methylase
MAQSCAVKGNLTRLCERGFYVAAPAMGNEVADAPRRRVKRAGVAPSPSQILRYVSWLLEREAKKDPRLLSSVEWEVEHERVRHANADPVDVDVMAALMAHASPPARVLDVGTGLGAVARAAAQEGFAVVATDFARRALERARSVDPKAPVTWIVDDATRTTLVSTFDVVIDRACLGCVPIAQRQIYAATLERLVNPGGVLILKAHAATGRPMRAYGFAREEVLSLFAPGFAAIAVRESTLDFGDIRAAPALHVELRRRP